MSVFPQSRGTPNDKGHGGHVVVPNKISLLKTNQKQRCLNISQRRDFLKRVKKKMFRLLKGRFSLVIFLCSFCLSRAATPDRKCKRDVILVRFQGDLWPRAARFFEAARIRELGTVLQQI